MSSWPKWDITSSSSSDVIGVLVRFGTNLTSLKCRKQQRFVVVHSLQPSTITDFYQYVFMWQLFYAATLACVKSSICVTVLRIATGKVYIRILQALIIMSVAMSGLGVVLVLVQCRPIEAHWIPSRGSCMGRIVPTVLTYAASVSNVITDFAVAVIPMCLVRKLQMRAKLKLYAQLIMGLGMLYVALALIFLRRWGLLTILADHQLRVLSAFHIPMLT